MAKFIDETVIEKLRKRKRILEMMTTMHSELFCKYRNRVRLLDIFLILFSVILLTTVFVDQSFLSNIGFNEKIAKIMLGLSSIAVTSMSLLSYIMDWKERMAQHNQAFKSLLLLKGEWEKLLRKEKITEESAEALEEKTTLTQNEHIAIDDSVFIKLKKKHNMKIELSKAVDAWPSIPLPILKLKVLRDDFKKSGNA